MAGVSVGQVYGRLTVIDSFAVDCLCRCSCGREIVCRPSQLISGRKTHCGCLRARRSHTVDLRGKRIHRLVALEPLDARDGKGSVIWRCLCDCGREIDVSYNMLMYGNMKSCGCRKREHNQALRGYLNHVDGTSIEMLMSSKVPSNNTTGVKGVYLSRGKYHAKMVIQGRQYHLGSFGTLEAASAARLAAEESIRSQLITAWESWRAQADQNPAWAQKHPFTFRVEKDKHNQLTLHIGQPEGA